MSSPGPSELPLNPLVSVVLAVRNGERFLLETMESVYAQDYRPLEVIVVDGHSTDRTAQIARSFGEARYLQQQGLGIASAYNQGIETSRGEFVAFISHDDLWRPNKLTSQVGYLLSHPEVAFTIARVRFVLVPGSAIPAGFRPELLQTEPVGPIMETLVARRSVFRRVGPFDPELATAHDVDWFARSRDYGITMAAIPEVLLIKRIHEANASLNSLDNNREMLIGLHRSVRRKAAREHAKNSTHSQGES